MLGFRKMNKKSGDSKVNPMPKNKFDEMCYDVTKRVLENQVTETKKIND